MLTRDPVTNVIINNEDSYYKTIVARRQDKNKNENLETELAELRAELSEIKKLLLQGMSGKNNG
jgi:hypothetical protein